LSALIKNLDAGVAGRFRNQSLDDESTVLARHRAVRQSADCRHGIELHGANAIHCRIAPAILGDDAEPKRFAENILAGQQRLPSRRRARDQRYLGGLRKFGELIGGESVDQYLEFKGGLHIGLQPQPGRSFACVSEPYGDGIAAAQETAAYSDRQRVHPRPGEIPIDPAFQHRTVGCLDRGVVGRGRLGELRLAHVGGAAPHDREITAVVDAELARGVGQHQSDMRSRHKRTGGHQRRGAHVFGQI
jgi:hypothetical protein